MRRIVIFLICLFLLSSSFLSPSASADNGDTTVYVTRTGYAYHRDGCYHLKSRIPMSLRDAVRSGHSPCRDCNPPLPDFTDSVSTAPTRSLSSERYSSRSSGSVFQPVFDWLNNLPRPVFIFLMLVFIAAAVFCSWLALSGFILLLSVIFGLVSRFFQWIRR